MGAFIIEKFYLFFQGIIMFQILFFGMLYLITKRREIVQYCLFLLCNTVYFFINAPFTFFNINDNLVFDSTWYEILNYFLILITNYFYLQFVRKIFSEVNMPINVRHYFKYTFWAMGIFFVLFVLFTFTKIQRSSLFYLGNLISIPTSIYIIYALKDNQSKFSSLISKGIFWNIAGTIATLVMIIRYNNVSHTYFFDEYPLLYLRIGILLEIIYYQLAIIRKWYNDEKSLATKDVESKLALEKMRSKISRDLHDDIGTTLSKINLTSFIAVKKHMHMSPEIEAVLASIQVSSQELVSKLKNIVASIDKNQLENINFMDQMKSYATEMGSSKEIKVHFLNHINSNYYLPEIETVYEQYIIFKEAINNAVKHSSANEITVTLIANDMEYGFEIVDNGIGLDNEKTYIGHGLKNMEERAKNIRAVFLINSSPHGGTIVKLVSKKLNVLENNLNKKWHT